jgi:hypothetical protein
MFQLLLYLLLGIWGTFVNWGSLQDERRKNIAILGIILSWVIPIVGIIIGYGNREKKIY